MRRIHRITHCEPCHTFVESLALLSDSFVEVEVGNKVNVFDSVGIVYEKVFPVWLQLHFASFSKFVDEDRKVKMKILSHVAPGDDKE